MRKARLLLALALPAGLFPAASHAQLQFGPGGGGGDGTWTANALDTNWFNSTIDGPWNNATPPTAIFGGAAGTVTIDNASGNVQAAGLTFNTSGYTIAGGPLTLSGTPAIVVGTATADVATINAILGGVTPTISGPGILELGGSNTFTGAMTINGSGAVRLTHVGALNSTTPIAVAFGASSTGVLQLNGNSVTVAGLSTNATVGTPIVENANATAAVLTINNAGAQTFAGTLQDGIGGGTLGLTKSGAGTLTRNSASTYTGVTTVSAGVLAISNATALGATTGNTTVASGAAVQVSTAITVAEPITLNGTGIANAGALRKTANNATSWSGAIVLGTGGARINSDSNTFTISGGISGAAQPLTVGGASNTTVSGAITTGVGGQIIKDGAGVLTVSNANNTFAAVDANSTVLTINAGVLSQPGESTSAAGANTPSGVIPAAPVPSFVFINGGTLRSSRVGVGVTFLATNKGITLGANGGALDVTDGVAGNLNIYQGLITGIGGLTKSGIGVLSLTAVLTYQGPTVVTGGTLRVRGAAERFPDATDLTVNSGGIFDLNGLSETVGSLAGAGNVNITGATGTPIFTAGGNNTSTVFSGRFTEGTLTGGRVTKTGTGTLTLSGDNLHTGLTTISAGGAIALQHNNALGTTAGSTTVASGAALQIDGNGLSIAEPLTISGTGLTTTGAIRNLANNNTLSGTITLAAAARIHSDAGLLTISGGVTGTTQTLTVGGNGNTAIAAAITTTTGGLTKVGTGTLEVGGANTNTGATTVNAGTLRITAAERLADPSAVTLGDGTFDINSVNETAGVLTVNAGTSTIDFGVGLAAVLTFATSTTAWNAAGILNIVNWSGVPNDGGGTERLMFVGGSAGLAPGNVAQIHFVDPGAPGGFYPAAILSTGEVVAVVPEPGLGALLALPLIGLLGRRPRARR